MIRLIGGRWKRTRLQVPDRPGLRPTPDRVRETLFNWLGQELSGWHVLDAYAGTGALGLEAASRGAAQVCLVEADRGLVGHLRATCERLGATAVQVWQADARTWMAARAPSSFDLVLLDPPFTDDVFVEAVRCAKPLLRPGGLIYLESDRAFSQVDCEAAGVAIERSGRAGAVHYHLLAPEALPVSDYTQPDCHIS